MAFHSLFVILPINVLSTERYYVLITFNAEVVWEEKHNPFVILPPLNLYF